MYELDGGTLLLTGQMHDHTRGRGVRTGARVLVHHALPVLEHDQVLGPVRPFVFAYARCMSYNGVSCGAQVVALACAAFSQVRILAFSEQGGGEEQDTQHTAHLETSPWRHVLEHTSLPDYWRILVLFRQLHAKVASWCSPQRLLASWSAFASPSEARGGGGLLGGASQGLLGGVLRHALTLLASPCLASPCSLVAEARECCEGCCEGRECCACVHGMVPDATLQRLPLVKRSVRDEFLAFFHRYACVWGVQGGRWRAGVCVCVCVCV